MWPADFDTFQWLHGRFSLEARQHRLLIRSHSRFIMSGRTCLRARSGYTADEAWLLISSTIQDIISSGAKDAELSTSWWRQWKSLEDHQSYLNSYCGEHVLYVWTKFHGNLTSSFWDNCLKTKKVDLMAVLGKVSGSTKSLGFSGDHESL